MKSLAKLNFYTRIINQMDGGLKRLGALFLKVCAVPLVPIGLGILCYDLFLFDRNAVGGTVVGATLVTLGTLLWILARQLDNAVGLIKYRRQQNQLLRLAQQRQGRLTVTEAATETGMTVQDAEQIMKDLADRGYVEIELTESGMMVYRFPEVLFSHEKVWSRSLDKA